MNTVRLSSLSLAGLLLATSALAADEAAGEDRVIRSAGWTTVRIPSNAYA